MRITVTSDHGAVSFRDDKATVGVTSLNDMFSAISELLQSLAPAAEPDEHIVLPFGFAGAEVAPDPEEE